MSYYPIVYVVYNSIYTVLIGEQSTGVLLVEGL